jgi:AAA domain
MKVLELTGENFRRLKAVRIRPDGAMVQVTGANDQGKSSVLDCLWALLKGRAVAGPEPIRRGAERAVLTGKLGDDRVQWEVERTFSRDKHGELTTGLKVTEVAVDGSRRQVSKSPQAVLDGFLGALSFDPLAFARAKPQEQFELLKSFVPGFDFAANAATRKQRFDERTDVNREAARMRATAATLAAKLPPGPKPKRIDTAAALQRLSEANRQKSANAAELRNRQHQSDKVRSMLDEAEDLRSRAVSLEKAANEMASAMAKLPPIPQDPDVDAISAAVMDADRVNAAVSDHEAHDKAVAEAMLHEAHSQDRTKAIEKLDKQRADAIGAAKMPVEGLTLGDGVVLFNSLPFEQASASARLKVSCAVAMAANPELRIIRTYDGSLLDQKSMGMLAAMATSRDYQVWCESVDESGEVGFVIVDGEVASGS